MTKEFVEHVHRQIEELVRARVSPLEQDISRLQREVNHAFTSLLERTDSAAAVPEDDGVLSSIAAGIEGEVGRASADNARLRSDLALLRDGVDHLGKQGTQAEVLNALIERASSFAPRLLLFVVKGDNALGWAAGGTEEPLDKAAVRAIAISLEADTILRAALASQQTFFGSADEQKANNLLISKLGQAHPERLLAVPLKVRGKSAAVLYADSSDRGASAVNVEALELLVSTTGFVVELTSLRARVGEAARPPAAAPAAKPAAKDGTEAPSGELPMHSGPLPPPPVAPPAEVHQPAAPAYFKPAAEPHQPAPQAAAPHAPAPHVPAPHAPVHEPAVAHSAPAAAHPGTTTPIRPPAEQPRTGPLRAPSAGDADEEQHNNARRFARLLVSEIKLYNEQKVVEGRNNNDLYDRLKEDIDRSRQMYEKRIPPTVTSRFDYFYDELVNTLAEGNPAKLGSDYPAPRVGA